MSFLFNFVKDEARNELRAGHYKFDVTNVSISEKLFLNPFWNFITNKIYPEWLAPNTITLMGFICMLVVDILVWINYPTVTRSMIWTFALIPILMFLYQTLDGSDGKQARRTGASSPLGEIFDHGVDAICMTIFVQSLGCALGMTPITTNGLYLGAVYVIQWFTFFTSHWEHYHTGTFYMGYAGACDAQLAIILIFIIGFFSSLIDPTRFPHGEDIWRTVMFSNITIGDAIFFFIVFNTGLACLRCAWSIMRHYQKPGTFTRRDREISQEDVTLLDDESESIPLSAQSSLKNKHFISALMDLIPLLVVALLFYSWIIMAHFSKITYYESYSDGTTIKFSTLFERDYMLYTSVGGVIFGINLTTLNIARVSNTVYPRFVPQYLLVCLGMIFHMVNLIIRLATGKAFIDEAILLYLVFAYTVFYYIIFVLIVGYAFCDALGISAFRIKKKAAAVPVQEVHVESDSENLIISEEVTSN